MEKTAIELRKIYLEFCIFLNYFFLFSIFLIKIKISKEKLGDLELGYRNCPLFIMLTTQSFEKGLYSKLVKKRK
jgi:hypothetical protein